MTNKWSIGFMVMYYLVVA